LSSLIDVTEPSEAHFNYPDTSGGGVVVVV